MCGVARERNQLFPSVAERGLNAAANLRQLGTNCMAKRGLQFIAKAGQLSSIVAIATAEQRQPLVAPLQHFHQQRFRAWKIIVEMAQQGFDRQCDLIRRMRQQAQRLLGSLPVERIAIFADFGAR